jgi:hypothetical protein
MPDRVLRSRWRARSRPAVTCDSSPKCLKPTMLSTRLSTDCARNPGSDGCRPLVAQSRLETGGPGWQTRSQESLQLCGVSARRPEILCLFDSFCKTIRRRPDHVLRKHRSWTSRSLPGMTIRKASTFELVENARNLLVARGFDKLNHRCGASISAFLTRMAASLLVAASLRSVRFVVGPIVGCGPVVPPPPVVASLRLVPFVVGPIMSFVPVVPPSSVCRTGLRPRIVGWSLSW